MNGKIEATNDIKTAQRVYLKNWDLNAMDEHLRMYHNGDQKFVIHSNNTGAWEKSFGYLTNLVRYGTNLFVVNANGKGNLSGRPNGGAGTSGNRLGDEIWRLEK